jgi:hypothetical protein
MNNCGGGLMLNAMHGVNATKYGGAIVLALVVS